MQSVASVTAVLLLSACGRIAFHPGTSDAALTGDLDARDGDVDAAACTGPFMAPALVSSTATAAHEWGAAITADGLELYFGSQRGGGAGGYDIYRATRASRSASFDAPSLVTEIATSADEDNAFVTFDGLELWFDRAGEIMRATRSDRMSPWQAAQPVAALNSAANDVAPMVSHDMLAVYFASERTPTMGTYDLYMATRMAPEDSFGAPVALTTINSPSFDCCPHVVEGGSKLMFTTNALVAGHTIAVVGLDASGMPTGPVSVADLDTTGEEVDVFETPDGTLRGYSYRPTPGVGDFDLYLMERACP